MEVLYKTRDTGGGRGGLDKGVRNSRGNPLLYMKLCINIYNTALQKQFSDSYPLPTTIVLLLSIYFVSFSSSLQRYQKLAEERYATRLADYTERLKKAQADGIVPIEEPEEPKKKEKKSVTSTKKSTSAKKKSPAKKKTKGAKKTSTSKSAAKSSTKSAKAELDEVDDDDKEDWLGPDDES